MKPFLYRLFRYRTSEGRTPLEDFLSELIAEFINKAPNYYANHFLLKCFIPDILHSEGQALLADRRVVMRTHVRLPTGRQLDLLAEVDGKPFVAIENKVWAAFQMHERPVLMLKTAVEDDVVDKIIKSDVSSDEKYDNQLVSYGVWLANEVEKPAGWPGVIVLLTHATPAPADFIGTEPTRYGSTTHLTHWRNIHAQLREIVGENENDAATPFWISIGQEICKFLEQNDMGSSDMNLDDVKSISLAMSPMRKLQAAFAETGAELMHKHQNILTPSKQSSLTQPEHSLTWGWTYIKGPGKFYIAYGINFMPSAGDNASANPALPDWDHVFVAIGSDKTEIRTGEDGFPEGWIRVGWHVLKPFPLTDRQQEERFPQFLTRLVLAEFQKMLHIKRTHDEIINSQ